MCLDRETLYMKHCHGQKVKGEDRKVTRRINTKASNSTICHTRHSVVEVSIVA